MAQTQTQITRGHHKTPKAKSQGQTAARGQHEKCDEQEPRQLQREERASNTESARKRRTRGGKSEAEGGAPVWLSAQHQPGTDKAAETRDRTGDLQIFSLTLSQLSCRGLLFGTGDDVERALGWCEGSVCLRISYEGL